MEPGLARWRVKSCHLLGDVKRLLCSDSNSNSDIDFNPISGSDSNSNSDIDSNPISGSVSNSMLTIWLYNGLHSKSHAA